MTGVSPGFVHTDFLDQPPDPATRTAMLARRDEIAIPPAAIAFALEQPADVDVGDIVVRPTAQA